MHQKCYKMNVTEFLKPIYSEKMDAKLIRLEFTDKSSIG